MVWLPGGIGTISKSDLKKECKPLGCTLETFSFFLPSSLFLPPSFRLCSVTVSFSACFLAEPSLCASRHILPCHVTKSNRTNSTDHGMEFLKKWRSKPTETFCLLGLFSGSFTTKNGKPTEIEICKMA